MHVFLMLSYSNTEYLQERRISGSHYGVRVIPWAVPAFGDSVGDRPLDTAGEGNREGQRDCHFVRPRGADSVGPERFANAYVALEIECNNDAEKLRNL